MDARCIDWTNGDENTVAIGAMDVIYESARMVVIVPADVYLGNSEANIIHHLLSKEDDRSWLVSKKKIVFSLSCVFPKILSAR